MGEQLKIWFLRDALEALERERPGTVERLRERIPVRLQHHLDVEQLRQLSPVATLPLDEGEDILLAIDTALAADSGGHPFESIGYELCSRVLAQGGGVVIVGDMLATVARLRTTLERPFLDIEIGFELQATDAGFTLTVGAPGRPRATRILKQLAYGAVRAAQRYSHQPDTQDVRLADDTLGDKSSIHATYRLNSSVPAEPRRTPPKAPLRRSASGTMRPPRAVTNVAAEVDRIFGARLASDAESLRPARLSQPIPAARVDQATTEPPAPASSSRPVETSSERPVRQSEPPGSRRR